jgi:hypothetical protein
MCPPVIYSHNEIFRQISDVVFNILSLVIFIYFSRNLLSNPVSCYFLLSFIFSFIIIGFFASASVSEAIPISNEDDLMIVKQENTIEPENINEQENIVETENINEQENIKYKLLLKKFKKLRKEFRETKNDIKDIKNELFSGKQHQETISGAVTELEPDLNQEFVDSITDIPDDEILDDIINQMENNYEIIQ